MSQVVDIKELNERIEQKSTFVQTLVTGMNRVIVGQKHLVESLLIGLLSDGHILLEGVPEGLSIKHINERMSTIEAVKAVHDLHVWNLGSDQVSLSAHVILNEAHQGEQVEVMEQLKQMLDGEFHIQHTTIQFEKNPCLDGHGGCN